MASEVSIEELQSEIDRLQLRMMMLRRVGIIPMDDVAVENGELQSAAIKAGRIVRRELDRALREHELFEDPAHALLALRGELDEVACAISVHDLTGPHGYLSEVAQVAAVAIKSVISYLWYREEQK